MRRSRIRKKNLRKSPKKSRPWDVFHSTAQNEDCPETQWRGRVTETWWHCALYYYCHITLSQDFEAMGVQLSLKATLPLAERIVTASDCRSNTVPWSYVPLALPHRLDLSMMFCIAMCCLYGRMCAWKAIDCVRNTRRYVNWICSFSLVNVGNMNFHGTLVNGKSILRFLV